MCLSDKITAIDIDSWVKVMERIAQETYEGKLKRGELDKAHILKTYQELNKATGTGYGKNWTKVNKETGTPTPEAILMQQNIFRFSGAKDALMLEEINRLLTKDGKMSNWHDFKQAVLKLNDKYNINYLQAEWQTAKQAGYMANLWTEYEDNKGLFPNLKYKTQGDDRVREEHDKLKDTIAPIDSGFWDSYYPPNGWRCRCYVVQTAETPTKEENIPNLTEKEVRPEFRINAGKSGQIFKEGTENGGKPHPYFMMLKDNNYKVAFELMKHNAPFTKVQGTKVKESIFADMREPARMVNLNEAKLISKNLDLAVDILPLINLKNYSSPEFRINRIIGDGVHRTGNIANTISNAFSNKLGKGGQLSKLDKTFISVNFGEVSNLSNNQWKSITTSVFYKMKSNPTVEFLVINYNNKSLIIYNKDIPKDDKEGNAYVKQKLISIKNTEGNK